LLAQHPRLSGGWNASSIDWGNGGAANVARVDPNLSLGGAKKLARVNGCDPSLNLYNFSVLRRLAPIVVNHDGCSGAAAHDARELCVQIGGVNRTPQQYPEQHAYPSAGWMS
jgi:hypothetical protein